MKLLSNSRMTHCVKSVQQTQIRHQFMYWKTCPGRLQCCTGMAGPCVHMLLLISSEWQRRRVLLGPLDQDLLFLYSFVFFPAPLFLNICDRWLLIFHHCSYHILSCINGRRKTAESFTLFYDIMWLIHINRFFMWSLLHLFVS